MPMDRFYIGPYDKNSGMVNAIKPFYIPDKAFQFLNNAYQWRDQVRKRFGSRWLGNTQQSTRLRVLVGTTAAVTGNLGATIMPGTVWEIGQMFSVGNTLFTVYQANGATYTTGAATATYNTATGSLVITGHNENPLTSVYFYPAQPVMGFVDYENGGDEYDQTIAFDTQFAYLYNSGTIGWERIAAEANAGAATWTGSNSQFFWGYSYNGANAYDYDVYVTNYDQTEKLRVLSTVAGVPTWDFFYPQISIFTNGGTVPLTIFLQSARMIIPFKNRLLVFGTWENESPDGMTFTLRNYPFRMRFSAVGSPLATNAWRQDIPGQGGGLDNELNEAFTSVKFVKDRLIAFCETATFEVVFQDNQVRPFQLRQINNELGAESTFSVVGFDKYALAIGDVGIVACTGANVERIDNSIPDEVFKIHQVDAGIERVYGIRDYFTEMAYWTFPDPNATSVFPYPKRVLVYNYITNTWAFNDDSFTAFGYFQPTTGVTWDSVEVTWDDDVSWDSGSNKALFRNVIAGNQQGWTMLIDRDDSTNAPALQITNITVSLLFQVTMRVNDFNLLDGDYVYFSGITDSGNLSALNGTIQQIRIPNLSDPNTFTFTSYQVINGVLVPLLVAGTYKGGGVISRVSRINFATKAFNFYATKGYNAAMNQVNFLVEATTTGKILVDWSISNSDISMVAASVPISGTGCITGTSVLETSPYTRVPLEAEQAQLWHQIYINAQGEYVQLVLYFDDLMMRDVGVREADFKLYAMIFLASRAGNLR